MLDVLLIAVPSGIVAAALGLGLVGWSAFQTTLSFVYNLVLDGGPAGATLGKRALRIAVRADETAGTIGYPRGAARAGTPLVIGLISSVSPLLSLVALLNYLWPLWDAKRQTWHDKAAGSVVLRIA